MPNFTSSGSVAGSLLFGGCLGRDSSGVPLARQELVEALEWPACSHFADDVGGVVVGIGADEQAIEHDGQQCRIAIAGLKRAKIRGGPLVSTAFFYFTSGPGPTHHPCDWLHTSLAIRATRAAPGSISPKQRVRARMLNNDLDELDSCTRTLEGLTRIVGGPGHINYLTSHSLITAHQDVMANPHGGTTAIESIPGPHIQPQLKIHLGTLRNRQPSRHLVIDDGNDAIAIFHKQVEEANDELLEDGLAGLLIRECKAKRHFDTQHFVRPIWIDQKSLDYPFGLGLQLRDSFLFILLKWCGTADL